MQSSNPATVSERPSPTASSASSAIQRGNMVESQVRPSDVTDRRIIRAMLKLPREEFVPLASRTLAYMDAPVPLEPGRTARRLMEARTYARLVQLAAIPDGATVLEIGCGTGYGIALLAQMCKRVVGLDHDAEMISSADRNLAALGITNAHLRTGDLAAGVAEFGPYDAIIVAGAIAVVPAQLLDQLKDGGRLVAVRGAGIPGKASVWLRSGTVYNSREHFDASADALPGFEAPAEFRL